MPSTPITPELTRRWRTKFYSRAINQVMQNSCASANPFLVSLSRKQVEKVNHVYSIKVSPEGSPVTAQNATGRCWIFAALNAIRIQFMKHYNLSSFEFSVSYLFFWDKIERANYFLHTIVDVLKRDESVDGRLMNLLLKAPMMDGGQWEMLVNLVKKYGLMPKKCFPETYSSSNSLFMNALLNKKIREFTKELVDMHEAEYEADKMYEKVKDQMCEIYRIVGICLSIPPEKFVWEYYDKNGEYKSIGPITPLCFYNEHIKKIFDIDNKACIIHDPRPSNKYGRTYTIDCFNNVVGGNPILYNNQPIEVLMDAVVKSIKNGDAVWFASDVGQFYSDPFGTNDLEIFDWKLSFGMDFLNINKADRLLYADSLITHAMVFTGISYDENDKPCKFRVENSWSETRGDKGYLLMTADWFNEFVYGVVVDKSVLSKDVLKAYEKKPIVLPLQDPFGGANLYSKN